MVFHDLMFFIFPLSEREKEIWMKTNMIINVQLTFVYLKVHNIHITSPLQSAITERMLPKIPNTIPRIPKMLFPSELELSVDSVVVVVVVVPVVPSVPDEPSVPD